MQASVVDPVAGSWPDDVLLWPVYPDPDSLDGSAPPRGGGTGVTCEPTASRLGLPPAEAPTMAEPRRPVARGADGLFVCGDHRDQPSIEGAIVSGLRTAEAIVGTR